MISRPVIILFLIFILYSMSIQQITYGVQTKKGTFDLKVNSFRVCKGPKAKNCSEVEVSVLNRTAVIFHLYMKAAAKVTKGKVLSKSNGVKSIGLQMNNPCQHIFLKELLMKSLDMTKSCVFPQGHHEKVLDISAIARSYYDGYFLHGNLTFHSILLSDDCNISCTILDCTVTDSK